MVEFNVAVRVIDFLKENVKPDMSAPPKTHAEMNKEDKVYEIKGLSIKTCHSIEYLIMLLSNITSIDEGRKHFLGENKTKGLVLENIFGMF